MVVRSIKEAWDSSYRESQNKPWWHKLLVVLVLLFTVAAIFGLLSSKGEESLKDGKEAGINLAQTSPSSTSNPSSSPFPTPQASSLIEPVFDSNLGNNYLAADFAKSFLSTANKAAHGYVKTARVDLTPAKLDGKDEAEYKKNLLSVYLIVEVDNHLWNTTGEAGQKDLAASFLNAISNSFGGIHHVKITNGIREVATAEWPLFGGEPKIELK